ncbi:ABC transporter permease [Acidisoma cellulosilytica]|uniref:Autoinducer 2 import system permease protein LsrD n=1 Tax=Acidisoma cellulosilyticum TaxID=2802395 RepID=A0A963Z5P0_9PROT|nr:ABC transporter permease [Acidisoma cellulosilyticum]MCB8882278.1 ABC transporter permease [Acidisoma cellulosilyticum]
MNMQVFSKGVSEARAKKALQQDDFTRSSAMKILSNLWAWLFLLLLVIFFSIAAPGFCNLFNFQSLGTNMAVLLVLALGQTFVILSGGIDLSVGFVMGLASVCSALAMQKLTGQPLVVMILAGLAVALVVGVIAGSINGLLVSRLKVPPFIATLGTLGIAQGVAYVLSGGPPVSVNSNALGFLGNGFVLYYHPKAGFHFFSPPPGITGIALRHVSGFLPLPVIYLAVITLVCAWVLARTKFGRHLYAVGGNAKAASRAGIPVNKQIFRIYMMSSLFAGLAGFLYVLRYSGGVANAGDALMLSSIAAIVIGGASLFGGEGKILGTVVGALIISVLQNGLIIEGIDPFWQYAAVGVVIILAVLMDQAKARIIR